MAHDVFISHSAKDKTIADAVCATLESNGIRCWIAPRDEVPGMEWGECIISAIEQSRIMVLIFTADANASPQIRREVERAVNRGVAILPVRVENVPPGRGLEYFIGNVHWLDALTPPLEAHLKSLATTIKTLLARADLRGALPVSNPTEAPREEVKVPGPSVASKTDVRSAENSSMKPPAAGTAPAAGLTQLQRVTYAFTAPSKTFEDIKRGNKSWWLPFIIMALSGYLLFAAVSQKIGMQQVVDNQVRMSARSQEQMAQLTPEQREKRIQISLTITKVVFLGIPVIGLIEMALLSLVLLGTINFVFGGKAKFGSIFAVYYYAYLPSVIKVLLGIVVIFAGIAPESFNIKNFAPTNLGAFLDPIDTNKALYALATSLDAVTVWTLVLLSIGIATVAGVKRSSGYIAVFGWWAIVVLVGMGVALVFG